MREPGFYWVMNEGRFEVWEWNGQSWWQPGVEGEWDAERDFPSIVRVISERIPEPTWTPSAER